MTATRVEDVPWEECYLRAGRNPGLEREMRRAYGMVPLHARYFADCPWVCRADGELNAVRGKLAHLDLGLAQRIALVVSQDNSCRYCFASVRALLRLSGMPEAQVRRLEQDVLVEDYPQRERDALALARQLSRADPMPGPEAFAALREQGYSDAVVKEIACVVASMCFANRSSTFPAIPPQAMERLPDRWFVRPLRPVLARWVRRFVVAGRPDSLEPELAQGDFAYVSKGLDGLPFARAIRGVIDDAWSCPHLSRRTKAFVIAVVARGLGCHASMNEAVRILGEEGLSRDEVERVLRDLASPKLTPVEAVAVPFARETIWYRPAQIQRRAREVHARLTGPQFLDLVGTASLANLLCRLGPVLPAD